jgi:propionate CoA-transferase
MSERLSYDEEKNIFFIDFAGLSVRNAADVEQIRQAVEKRLAPLAHKVNAIVNYDRFSIVPELVDDYVNMVKGLMDSYYHDVTRYTSSTFLRIKLAEELEKRQLPAHVFASEAEAQGHFRAS